AISGRMVKLHAAPAFQWTGSCAETHNARGVPAASTRSAPSWYSNAVTRRALRRSTIVSERTRHNANDVFDWCGPTSMLCLTVRLSLDLYANCVPTLGASF